MRRFEKIFFVFALLVFAAASSATTTRAASPSTGSGILITNDDQSGTLSINTATLFTIQSDGSLGSPTKLTLGGHGAGGGYFDSNRVVVDSTSTCAYLAAGVSNTIVGVNLSSQTVTGTFSASASDNGTDNGMGMIMNSSYLYAAFSSSGTVATYAVQSGCTLQFISDIAPSGLNAGTVKGMAINGSMMVFTYGDGSIESFNIAQGVPVSNGDAQNSTGSGSDNFPDGVVITSDGHFAIFGDDSSGAAVEVSDVSSGQLTPTVIYNLPSGFNSNNVLLSPDETLLYVINNTSGQVSAAFFDNITGTIGASCISNQLNGFDDSFSFLSNPVTQQPSGTGGMLYVPEFGSSIALINVSSSAGQCTLTEAAGSPVTDPNSASLLSIAIAQTTQAGLYNPAPNSTLTGSDVTFQWYDAAGATASWIDVGSVPGGNQYYQSGSLPPGTLSATVRSLPTNGSPVYATLYFLIGSWTPNPYTFTAFNAQGSTGVLTTPAPGSTLNSTTVTFSWTAGLSASAYWLDLGSVAGGNQYYQSGNLGNALSTTASGLPSNGSTVYATLYSLVGGSWVSNSYTYTAFNVAAAGGVITSPTPGSILPGSIVTFNWSAGAGASAYWLDLGSVPGGNTIYQSGNLGNVLTTTVNGIPTDGSTVYATLYSMIGGSWLSNGYSYTALNATGQLAVMQTPPPGSTLSGNSATFTWSVDASATAYWVDIGTVPGGNTIYQSGNLGNVQSLTVNSLPANGTTIYVTLYSYVGGEWLSTSCTYTSGP